MNYPQDVLYNFDNTNSALSYFNYEIIRVNSESKNLVASFDFIFKNIKENSLVELNIHNTNDEYITVKATNDRHIYHAEVEIPYDEVEKISILANNDGKLIHENIYDCYFLNFQSMYDVETSIYLNHNNISWEFRNYHNKDWYITNYELILEVNNKEIKRLSKANDWKLNDWYHSINKPFSDVKLKRDDKITLTIHCYDNLESQITCVNHYRVINQNEIQPINSKTYLNDNPKFIREAKE